MNDGPISSQLFIRFSADEIRRVVETHRNCFVSISIVRATCWSSCVN